MPESRELFIPEAELKKYITDGPDAASKTKALLAQQKESWPLLNKNYAELDKVEFKKYDFNGFELKVQFNPGRIVSSSAKVDEKSIKERKCFLCQKNLPAEQRAVSFNEEYNILCNPFPIFPEHFTLPNTGHVPQRISDSFSVFLDFCRDLGEDFTVFYNGPKCGASAPDHLHFQAGSKYFMPLDSVLERLDTGSGLLFQDSHLKIYAPAEYPVRFFAFESAGAGSLERAFIKLYRVLEELNKEEAEPMMNIIGNSGNGKIRVAVFPREKHRPSHFFAEGEANILLSPASVDMGGVMITPLEKDFRKITKTDIENIFSEISPSEEKFTIMKKALLDELTAEF
ncbi:MAG: DUF4922 domain-containing protein [Syntrophothermus sp.]